MKTNPTRYSSAAGDVRVMETFKAQYCPKIFAIRDEREIPLSVMQAVLGKFFTVEAELSTGVSPVVY